MPDWRSSMEQTFEYYVVDPGTWKDVRLLNNVKSCSINRDYEADTLGSASIDTKEMLGECYIRAYLITNQNGVREKHPLGTFLVQTPSSSFDGKTESTTMDAYTPLIELKEKNPALGYSVLKGTNVMDTAYRITRENVRAPVVKPSCDTNLYSDFVADPSDTWMSFTSDLMENARYIFELDELGRVLFAPKQDIKSMQPVWTFDDSNSSILYPDITREHDLFDIPNVVEVVYSDDAHSYYAKAVNDDPTSDTSTVSRGREIMHRVTNPGFSGAPSQEQIDEYAKQLLSELSTIDYTISYSHGYCPVRIGDCVRISVKLDGKKTTDIKARVISQNIKCEPGCPVSEKAVYTAKLWR